MRNKLYKYAALIVDRKYLVGKHELKNDKCSVDYRVGEKLTVCELQANDKDSTVKRFFIVKEKDGNIDKCWCDICRFFEDSVTLDILSIYITKYLNIKVNVCEVKLSQSNKPKQNNSIQNTSIQNNLSPIVEKAVETAGASYDFESAPNIDMKKLSKIVHDAKIKKYKKPMTNYEMYQNDLESQQFYNIGDIRRDKTNMPNNNEESDNSQFVDISNAQSQAANNYNKINVNTATSEEIATLPGINVIIAKKIVRFRDLNGDFKSIDDFFKVAQVKDHFIPTLKAMIILDAENSSKDSNDDTNNSDDSRIIDF